MSGRKPFNQLVRRLALAMISPFSTSSNIVFVLCVPLSIPMKYPVIFALYSHYGFTKVFRSAPRPSIATSNTSPSFSSTGGLRKTPTPSGVPVAITSPGSSVMP